MEQSGEKLVSTDLQMLRKNKLSGYNYRYRRHFDWDENYELYRDKVIVNRLTQRQSVNMPMMKGMIGSIMKEIDDMPVVYFENLDNNKQAELFKNDYWKETVEHNNMELQDIVDKKQAGLFGRTFDQWQIKDGWVTMTVQDPYDILVSRYVDPTNIHTSRFLIHTNIFVPLSSLRLNKDYDTQAVKGMEDYYANQQGLVRATENERLFIEKNQRLADLGVQDIYNPILGETYVNLTLHFVWKDQVIDKEMNVTDIDPQIYMYVEADNMRILMCKPLEEVIDPQGRCKDHFWRYHFPYVTWSADLERLDFWNDGPGDIIRTPNKIVNVWFSQLVENRTLRNLGMNFYNSNLEGFTPQNFTPEAFGWYGIPVPPNANLSEVFQPVKIEALTNSIEEINFIKEMVQEATGANSTQPGQPQPTQITLGEVQLMVNEAKERIKGMSKFYTKAWKDRALLFLKLVEANPDKLEDCTIYRKGRNTSAIFKREISPKDWMTPSGYGIKIWSQDEKNAMDTDALNKLNAVKANMPDNQALTEIYQRKLLQYADLTPEEVNTVMKQEEENQKVAKAPVIKEAEQITIPYQYAPPDIQAQIEASYGFKPSTMRQPMLGPGASVLPGAPQPGGTPSPNGGMPQLPAQVQPNQPNAQPSATQAAG